MIARIPSSTEIIDAVAEVTGVPVSELVGYDTCREYRVARIVGATMLREVRKMSYQEIMRKFNRRSHTTVRGWLMNPMDDDTREMVERVRVEVGRMTQ